MVELAHQFLQLLLLMNLMTQTLSHKAILMDYKLEFEVKDYHVQPQYDPTEIGNGQRHVMRLISLPNLQVMLTSFSRRLNKPFILVFDIDIEFELHLEGTIELRLHLHLHNLKLTPVHYGNIDKDIYFPQELIERPI